MKVYTVRHGQIPSNALRRYPYEDEQLTELGIEQAAKLRDRLKNTEFDVIVCSPLNRAKQTASIINSNNYRIIYDERIKERGYGDLAGNPLEIIDRGEWWNYNSAVDCGTSENIRVFFKRIFDFLNDLKTRDYDKVLIVAHAGVLKAVSGYFEGMGDGNFIDRKFDNCGLREYELL